MNGIPAFLLRENQPRFLVADTGELIITKGEAAIELSPDDIQRLSAFVQRFDKEEEKC